jgi:tetratricopeptide (TPR) repeat protein
MKTLFVVTLLGGSLLAQTATPAPQHEANFDQERKQANDLFVTGKILDSLPLYEDLCRQDQTIAVFAERHGTGLIKKSAILTDPAEQKAMNEQGMAEIRRAQKLGDNSPYVQTMLTAGTKNIIASAMTGLPLSAGYLYHGSAEAQPSMKEAEATFARENPAGALKLYMQAAKIDPKWYDAALYSGDMYFRLNDAVNAGIWFQKAIDIDPDRDTAYRYWGDALLKSGEPAAAKVKFEQAFVAEPYVKPGWLSLVQWANRTKTQLHVPQVALPKFEIKDGAAVPDAALQNDAGDGRKAWLAYENCRATHHGKNQVLSLTFALDKDGSTHPSGYYHSLAEETECLHDTVVELNTMLARGAVTQDKLDPSLKTLLTLDKNGVLPCWILLNAADQGIRFDYPAFRRAHREELVAYVDRYIVQAAP